MELHGKNPQQNVIAIIPARYASTRLPGKLLLEIEGKPLILHTLEQAAKARNVSRVIVATDDERIDRVVRGSGGEAVMTSSGHTSGTDRLAEVAAGLPADSVIVNVQGDEPMISPRTIEAAVDSFLSEPQVDMVTTSEPIADFAELTNGNVVKVVTNDSGRAVYFSRSPIPYPREAITRYGNADEAFLKQPELLSLFRKHTGLYVYRRDFLLRFARLPPSRLEKIEMLEQLRALENGARIRVVEVEERSIGVDTQADLERVRAWLAAANVSLRRATEDDIPRIAQVYVESVRRSFAGIEPESYLKALSARRREDVVRARFALDSYMSFVAENDVVGVVGFIDCGKPLSDALPFERQVFSFYLLSEFQRKGIGHRLFARCVAEIVKKGCNSLCLDTIEASPYRGFYEKAGGEIVGKGTHRIGDENFATVIYGWDSLQAV